MRKCANISPYMYEEVVSHIWLCNCFILNFLKYEEFFFSFLSVRFLGTRISLEMNPLTWLKDKKTVDAVRHFNSAKDQPFTWRKYREQYRKYSCSSVWKTRSRTWSPAVYRTQTVKFTCSSEWSTRNQYLKFSPRLKYRKAKYLKSSSAALPTEIQENNIWSPVVHPAEVKKSNTWNPAVFPPEVQGSKYLKSNCSPWMKYREANTWNLTVHPDWSTGK